MRNFRCIARIIVCAWSVAAPAFALAGSGVAVEERDFGPVSRDSLFQGGGITMHTGDYDSLLANPRVAWLFTRTRYSTEGPYPARWVPRATLLALAFHTADGLERSWLKRALELTLWQASSGCWHAPAGAGANELMRAGDLPLCLDANEVCDLFAIDRAFRTSEERALRRAPGNPEGSW